MAEPDILTLLTEFKRRAEGCMNEIQCRIQKLETNFEEVSKKSEEIRQKAQSFMEEQRQRGKKRDSELSDNDSLLSSVSKRSRLARALSLPLIGKIKKNASRGVQKKRKIKSRMRKPKVRRVRY